MPASPNTQRLYTQPIPAFFNGSSFPTPSTMSGDLTVPVSRTHDARSFPYRRPASRFVSNVASSNVQSNPTQTVPVHVESTFVNGPYVIAHMSSMISNDHTYYIVNPTPRTQMLILSTNGGQPLNAGPLIRAQMSSTIPVSALSFNGGPASQYQMSSSMSDGQQASNTGPSVAAQRSSMLPNEGQLNNVVPTDGAQMMEVTSNAVQSTSFGPSVSVAIPSMMPNAVPSYNARPTPQAQMSPSMPEGQQASNAGPSVGAQTSSMLPNQGGLNNARQTDGAQIGLSDLNANRVQTSNAGPSVREEMSSVMSHADQSYNARFRDRARILSLLRIAEIVYEYMRHQSELSESRLINLNEDNQDNIAEHCPRNGSDGGCQYLDDQVCYLCHMPRVHSNRADEHLVECITRHETQSQVKECSICFEKVIQLGTERKFCIQENCSHCFCSQCLEKWRKNGAMANNRACPLCRTPSEWVLKSQYWIENTESKKKIFECAKRRAGL